MKNKLLLALIFIVIFCLFKPVKEGFITSDYNTCRSKGISKEFCVKTPLARNVVGTCLCKNGEKGLLMPGFQGKCVCGGAGAFAYYDS